MSGKNREQMYEQNFTSEESPDGDGPEVYHIERESETEVDDTLLENLEKVKDKMINVPPGLFIIYGPATAGKSKRLARLSQSLSEKGIGHDLLFACEPDHRSIGGWEAAKAHLLETESRLTLVDSIKDVVYASGSLGSGGVSITGITDLAAVSSHLMASGQTVVAIINPAQEAVADPTYELIKSNVTGVFYYTNPNSEYPDRSSYRIFNGAYYERLEGRDLSEVFDLLISPADVETSLPTLDPVVRRYDFQRLDRILESTRPTNEQDFDNE